jgi:phosphatidylinositol phospholipase C delta
MSESSRPGQNLSSRLSGLNPFSKKRRDDDDELGEEITPNTIAGGGHGGRAPGVTKSQLLVSHVLRSFLVDQSILSEEDAALDILENLTSTAGLKA